jgi:hypothetical protein
MLVTELIEKIQLLRTWRRKHSIQTGIFVTNAELDNLLEEIENLAIKISSNPMLSDQVCVHPFENVVINGTDICCFKCGKKLK